MSNAAAATCPAPPPAGSGQGPAARARSAGLGAALVIAVCIAGSPDLAAPWIQGDEFVFIARNADVNPRADETGPARPLATRLGRILTSVHDDLYQPVPILTYALEWAATGGSPGSVRRTDLLLHAVNALLLWRVLAHLLRRLPGPGSAHAAILGWAAALLWAVHPVLVTAYAADMGRTHILSATFALAALWFYQRAVEPGRGAYFAGALSALLLAMLSKPVPGWLLLALALEAAQNGWRRAVRSPRVWVVGLVCVAFAALTVWTSFESGLAADASEGLFGDPLARSALAAWIHLRNLVAPLWLAPWYPPDPQTHWGNWRVWAGAALAALSIWHAARCWRRPESRTIAIGWIWCWATLLAVIGLVGAREAAAADRYFYQPLMGIMLVLAALTLRAVASRAPAALQRYVVPAAGGLAAVLVLLDLPQASAARSTLRRATRVAELNPGDPRALEGLAAAYDFARNHPLPPADAERIPPGAEQFAFFNDLFQRTLIAAAAAENLADYFPGPEDRAPFHRRLSYRFLTAGLPEHGLAQAQIARELQPGAFATWKRLAHAYQALRRHADADAAYARCEQLLPDDPRTRAVHYTDYGLLLMFDLGRDAEACPRFEAALATGKAPRPAKTGLALCLVRYGEGQAGYALISEVLAADPGNVQARLVLGEYHLRSNHWEQAGEVYGAILRDQPTNYAALRGFHEVCVNAGFYDHAAKAWGIAARLDPGRREFASFFVWAEALAGEAAAAADAAELLEVDADNPFACLAQMLLALRAGDVPAALDWVRRARAGAPVPAAREFERAAATLRLLADRGALPAEAAVAMAAVRLAGSTRADDLRAAAAELEQLIAAEPDAPWTPAGRRLLADCVASTAPASEPCGE